MRILLLNQTFHPDVSATAQYLGDLAVALAERGHRVEVITGRRSYDDPRKVFLREERWQGINIFRVCSSGLGKNAKWRRIVDSVTFIALCLAKECFMPKPHLIVSLTSPPLIGAVGLLLARRHRTRCVQWVMDLNPDEAIAAGWLRAGSAMANLLERASRWSLRGADKVVVLDRFVSQRVRRKGVLSERVSTIPLWADQPAVSFDPNGRAAFRAQHGLSDKFVVMYSGNHTPCHPLATVVEAARRLVSRADIAFCFVGGGSEFERIQKLKAANAVCCSNLVCLPYQPRRLLASSLSAADIHLVTMGEPFVGIVHPSKVYNLMAIGIPLLYVGATPSPVLDTLMRNSDYPLEWHAIRQGDVDELVRRIEALQSASKDRCPSQMSSFRTAFSKDSVLPLLIAELESFQVDESKEGHSAASPRLSSIIEHYK